MKPLFIAASPNTQKDDVLLALKLLFSPWNWFNKKSTENFEKRISEYLNSNAVAFDSARTSLYYLLKAYGIGEGDEVIMPAFSCLVVANAIIWSGAKPIYVDINRESYNLDLSDLSKKISSKTKAVLVQHTFGKIVDIQAVRKIVGPKVIIIEDAAHALGGNIGKADATILTFGIEKVISSVRGGMAVVKDEYITKKLREYQQELPRFSLIRVKFTLLNPLLWTIITPIYYLGFGKFSLGRIITWILHKMGVFGTMIENEEYKALKPKWFPAKYPGALARLAANQFEKLDMYNEHRREIAHIYARELGQDSLYDPTATYLRYPVLVKDRNKLLVEAKKHKVVLGDWYKNILYAPNDNYQYFGYEKGMCPVSELVASQIVNLPTGIKVDKLAAQRISAMIKPYLL